jgi:hypothetical protein
LFSARNLEASEGLWCRIGGAGGGRGSLVALAYAGNERCAANEVEVGVDSGDDGSGGNGADVGETGVDGMEESESPEAVRGRDAG